MNSGFHPKKKDENETVEDENIKKEINKIKKKLLKKESFHDNATTIPPSKMFLTPPLTSVYDVPRPSLEPMTEYNVSQETPSKKYIPFPSPIPDTPSKTYSNTEELFQETIAKYISNILGAFVNEDVKLSSTLSYKENFEDAEKTWFENYLWKSNQKLYHIYIKYKNNSNGGVFNIDTSKLGSFDGIKNQFYNVTNTLYFYYSFTLFFIIEVIMIAPNAIKEFITSGSYQTTRFLTTEDNITDDQITQDSHVLVNIIYCILTFPIVVYVTYNWYFLTAYFEKVENNEIRPARDENRYKIRFYNGYGMVIKPILIFLFDAALKPLEKLDGFFFGDTPFYFPFLLKMIKYDSEISLNNIKRFILLLIAVFFVYYLNFFTTMDVLLKGESQTLVYICGAIIIIFQTATFYNYIMAPMFNKDISPTEIATDYAKYTLRVINPLVFIFLCLLYIGILFAQAILVAHPSAIICLIYFWFHSIFGIALYGEGQPFSKKWFLHIKSMEDEFDKDVNTFYRDDKCVNPGILKIIVRNIIKIIRCNLNLIVLMFILFSLFMKSILTLNSESFKFSICMFLGLSILALIPKFIYDMYRDFQQTGYQMGDPVCRNDAGQNDTFGDDKPDLY